MSKIAIIGLGYVGLPLAYEFSKVHDCVGYDISKKRIRELKKGIDKTEEYSKENILDSKLLFTNKEEDLFGKEFYIITVPTPLKKNNKPDLSPLKSASKTVGKHISKGSIIIYESTVYPGCTEEDCIPILEKYSNLQFNKDFFCGYSPERINPGDKNRKLKNIVKVVSGSNKKTTNSVNKLYKSIIKAGTYIAPSIKVAEASKIIENVQRDVNISLINEFALIFEKLNLDTKEVLDAAATKWNFLKFRPGLVGGHCIGVDPYYLTYLASIKGFNPNLIIQARKINEKMGNFHANKILNFLNKNKVSKKKILICGFAFKANCSDYRNTGVIKLYKALKRKNLKIDIFDPLINSNKVYVDHKLRLITKLRKKNYDMVILAVDHKKFKKLGKKYFTTLIKNRGQIYDLKNLFH